MLHLDKLFGFIFDKINRVNKILVDLPHMLSVKGYFINILSKTSHRPGILSN